MNATCCYCRKVCDTVEENERVWRHPVKGRVTCCNSCGGYETCPECGHLWENLHRIKNALCFECSKTAKERQH